MFEYLVTYENIIGLTTTDVVYANSIQEAWRQASNESSFDSVPTNVELLGTV